jgi:hypothetical protein
MNFAPEYHVVASLLNIVDSGQSGRYQQAQYARFPEKWTAGFPTRKRALL